MFRRHKKPADFRLAAVCVLLVCYCAISGKLAGATTYCVSPSGSDGNRGTVKKPFRTIQKAANVVNPGDIVIVKKGTYTGGMIVVNIARGGTASNWITFKSENQWGAVIDGQNNSSDYCINLTSNANYVRIEGFEIKGCLDGGIWSNAQSNDVYIYGNKIHHISYGLTAEPTAPGRNGVFQGVGTSDYTYDSNIFYTIGRKPHNHYEFHDYGHDHGIYIRGTASKIINNIFYDLKAGYGIQVAPEVRGLDIVNNTFVGPNPGRDGGGIMLWNNSNCAVTIKNNIFASFTRHGITYCGYTPSGVNTYNNLTSSGVVLLETGCTNSGIAKHNEIEGANPLFANSVNDNFHLRSGSPAIDRGYNVGAPPHDRDKTIRPQGRAVDIGAYEYVPDTN